MEGGEAIEKEPGSLKTLWNRATVLALIFFLRRNKLPFFKPGSSPVYFWPSVTVF